MPTLITTVGNKMTISDPLLGSRRRQVGEIFECSDSAAEVFLSFGYAELYQQSTPVVETPAASDQELSTDRGEKLDFEGVGENPYIEILENSNWRAAVERAGELDDIDDLLAFEEAELGGSNRKSVIRAVRNRIEQLSE